jgi:guanylate kinase
MSTGKIFVFSAPSGAGKTTILDHLRAAIPGLVYSISATTRLPRRGETNGVHYHFFSVDEFKRQIEQNAFAEWQVVHNNYYGTPKKFIDDTIAAGRHIVMDIDVYGKKKFDICYPDSIGILILPPSLGALEKRLRARGTDSEEVIAVRLGNAQKEIDFAQTDGKYEYTIVNEDLAVAETAVVALVSEVIGPH